MANESLKKLNYQIGRICRIGSRRIKLMAVNNRRKQQLRHLGERIYILKTLQQDDNIWEKDEISQLLLTIADLDQEIEMIIEEINEIKAETPPEELLMEAPATEETVSVVTPEEEKSPAAEAASPKKEAPQKVAPQKETPQKETPQKEEKPKKPAQRARKSSKKTKKSDNNKE
jgi:outer membrane biosynthesis protein TonB